MHIILQVYACFERCVLITRVLKCTEDSEIGHKLINPVTCHIVLVRFCFMAW